MCRRNGAIPDGYAAQSIAALSEFAHGAAMPPLEGWLAPTGNAAGAARLNCQ